MTQPISPEDAWETFHDHSYFDMWCVRKVGEREFGRGFHLMNGDEGKGLCDLLNTLTPPPSALDEEVVRLRSALAHWDSQALAWLGTRAIEAQPGWMVPAIRIGREALGEPFPDALRTSIKGSS